MVILDYMMPGMNGELAAGVMRAVAPKTAILAFSAIIQTSPAWSDAFLPKSGIADLPNAIISLAASHGVS